MGQTTSGNVERSVLCPCGCGKPPSGGSKYHDPERCRRRRYDRDHPRVMLSRRQVIELAVEQYERLVGA